MVHKMAWPLLDNFRIRVAMDQAVWLSRPEVGSSRKRSKSGLAASSTPMLSRFRCSTLRPNYRQVSCMMSCHLLARVVPIDEHGRAEHTFSRHADDSVCILAHVQ